LVWCGASVGNRVREEGHMTNLRMVTMVIMRQGTAATNTNVHMHNEREHT
jgi:hypothetical protein